ncbi:hypothetical protein [Spirosoma validum]|uniref:YtxH domain-containing protein n=1 Tax=Spirosoma validum TaxID=2771355 RepID=A0A927GF69_9BACT|nr:hypothetical protein [Spirosoma validum]MBD2755529.1 hypothetical protein [Spirosoma validum]
MKTTLLSVFAFITVLTTAVYGQDSTTTKTKEKRQQEWAERKARVKEDLNETGQVIKQKAKVANEAVGRGAQKVGETVNKGLDKAENAIVTEADKLKAKRDSSKAEKARRDTL